MITNLGQVIVGRIDFCCENPFCQTTASIQPGGVFLNIYGVICNSVKSEALLLYSPDEFSHHAMVGSPQERIEQLAMYGCDYDADSVIVRFCRPAEPKHGRELNCIRLFGKEMLPWFHK